MLQVQAKGSTMQFLVRSVPIHRLTAAVPIIVFCTWSAVLLADEDKGPSAAAPVPAELDFVPRDALGFVTVRVADLWTSEVAKALRQRVMKEKAEKIEKLEDYGLTLAGVERVTAIMGKTPNEILLVVTTTKPYSLTKVLRLLGSQAEVKRDAEKKYYESDNQAIHAVSDCTFILGSPNDVKDVLDRVDKKPQGIRPNPWQVGQAKHHVVIGINPTKATKALGLPVPPVFEPLLQSARASLNVDFGAPLSATLHLAFTNADQAKEGEKAIKAGSDWLQGILSNFLDKDLDPEGEAETPHLIKLARAHSAALKKMAIQTNGNSVEVALAVNLDVATTGGALAELSRANEGYTTGKTFAVNGQKPKDPTQSNLQKLAQAMLRYHKDHGHLPANAIYSKNGEPLLSWRVELLPYLDREEMYKRFKLNEPWDSPDNIKLIDNMPEIFNDWGTSEVNKHKATRFRVFSGRGTAFEGTQGLRLADFTDGSATTFLIVLAHVPVPWTKPDLLPYLPNRPLCKLGGGSRDNGFYAACADGRVHLIKEKTEEKTIRALITRNGGEKVRLPDEP